MCRWNTTLHWDTDAASVGGELQVHTRAFTMTKRRALTVGRLTNTQIESEFVDIKESILSKAAEGGAEGEPLLSTSLTAR